MAGPPLARRRSTGVPATWRTMIAAVAVAGWAAVGLVAVMLLVSLHAVGQRRGGAPLDEQRTYTAGRQAAQRTDDLAAVGGAGRVAARHR